MRTLRKVYVSYGKTVMDNWLDRATGRTGIKALRDKVRNELKEWATRYFSKTHLPVGRRGPAYKRVGKLAVHWDWKLGCGCGCSPGFRIKTSARKGLGPWESFKELSATFVPEELTPATVKVKEYGT